VKQSKSEINIVVWARGGMKVESGSSGNSSRSCAGRLPQHYDGLLPSRNELRHVMNGLDEVWAGRIQL
jgi:hypothetical protein